MKQKYVVGTFGGIEAAIVFPEYVIHADAARCFDYGSVKSGGFFYAVDDAVIPYGESTSLRVKSNPEKDAWMIGMAIGHPAYES